MSESSAVAAVQATLEAPVKPAQHKAKTVDTQALASIAYGAEKMGVVAARDVRVWEDKHRTLHVTVKGRDFEDVRAVKAFPISAMIDYISFLDEDDKEIAMVCDPANLDKDSRAVLVKALARMYYVAHITRVFSVTELHAVSTWKVMTDRGYAVFEVLSREHIRELPGGRFVMMDADGNRFELEDITQLDEESLKIVMSET